MRKNRIRQFQSNPRGFSLLELTVAMGLSLILLGTVLSLFDQLYYLSDSAMAIADTNQTIRASINLVTRDVKAAGSGIPTGGIPLPSGTGIPNVKRPGPGSLTFPASTPPNLSAVTPGMGVCNGASTINQRCDEITTVMVDALSQLNQYPVVGMTSTQITIDSRTNIGAAPSQVNVGDLIMLSNTAGAALGYVTAVTPGTGIIKFASGDPMQLNQPTATAGNIAALGVTCSGSPVTCTPATYAYRIVMTTYYLDNSTATQPKLMKLLGYGTVPIPVTLNVTGMTFTYDLSDGVSVNQPNPTQPNQIRKASLAVTARSSNPLRKSRAYFSNTISTSMMLRNLAYSNKYAT